jgi:hypothetical protein
MTEIKSQFSFLNFLNLSTKWLFRFIIGILLLIILISLLFQLPFIQNKAADATEKYLSKKTNSTITLDKINISIFDGLELENLTIVEGDTVLSTKNLKVKLNSSLFTLINNRLEIKSATISQPKLNLKIDPATGKINLLTLIDKLSKKDTTSNGPKLDLRIKNFRIENLDLTLLDELKKKTTKFNTDLVDIVIEYMDLNNNTFDINHIKLEKPRFETIAKFVKSELGKSNTIKVDNDKPGNPLCLKLRKLDIINGGYNNQGEKSSIVNHFDKNNFRVANINLNLKNLIVEGSEIYANLDKLNLDLDNKIKLENLSSTIIYNKNAFELANIDLRTKATTVKTSVKTSFDDVSSLLKGGDDLFFDVIFDKSNVDFNEIVYFVPSLDKSTFVRKYKDNKINLAGQLLGRVDNIKGKNFELNLGKQIDFAGNFGLKNVKEMPHSFLNLKVEKLKTGISFIKDLIPGFNPPENFYTLGNIDFKGNFDGYLDDFVTSGVLRTDIGSANLDMRLDVKEGNELAKYSGDLELVNFDLFKWSGGNQDLGKVSLDAKIKNGRSLLFKKASAEMVATINKLDYKNYTYKDVNINGKISPEDFVGAVTSRDPYIDFDFDGSVKFNNDKPLFNFDSKIRSLNLAALNLHKDIKQISGDITFKGSGFNLDDLIGEIKGEDLVFVTQDTTYKFNKFFIEANNLPNSNKQFQFKSDDANINLEGKFDFKTIKDDVIALIKTNYPYHTKNWDVVVKPLSPNQKVKFDIDISNPLTFIDLLGLKDIKLKSFKGKGSFNTAIKELNIVSSVPYFAIKDNSFFNIQLLSNNIGQKGDLLMHLDSFKIGDRNFNKIDIQSILKNDEVEFVIDAKELTDSVQSVNIKGLLLPHPKGYSISIINNDLRLFDKRWKISNLSSVAIGDKFIDIKNFQITDGNRSIDVDDVDNKGILLKLNKIDLVSINPLLKYDKIQFSGEVNSSVTVNDIFIKSPSINGNVNIPALAMNGEEYGELILDIAKAEDRPLEALLSISNNKTGQAIKVKANYDLATQMLNADVKAKKLSLKWLEYILYKGIKDLKGNVDLDATVLGNINNLKIDGKAVANEGSVKVIYLGETYTFDKQSFTVTEKEINLTGAKLKDSQGNEGNIIGSMRHKMFKGFILDCSIYGNNVIAINTTKYDNQIYYGLGKGELTVDFIGSVDAPKLVINCVTKAGTVMNIPIKESRSLSDKSFINYIDKDKFYSQIKDTLSKIPIIKVEGMSIEMNLTMTEEAQVNMIFDEVKNDIIKGVGKGNIKLSMSNKGDFDMFGTYTVTRGEYLFTALGFVNKPFLIREGGTIRWTGDPVNASINIVADYPVRTTLTNFIQEYLSTDQLKAAAGVTQDVNLNLLIGNTLYNPSINFDFQFPNLTQDLKTYTDAKIRLLKNNVVEYNSQVFGLVVFSSFMPSNDINRSFGNSNFISSAGINTLSEFVGSQFSIYMTSFINSALGDNGWVSGIDFDLNLINSSTIQGQSGTTTQASLLPNEIQVRFKNKFRFLDERLTLNVAGNYVRQNPLVNDLTNYIIPEFFVEYALTKDRQLNFKLYGKYDLDEIALTNRRQKIGIGIRYKSEFGSMRETRTGLSQKFKEVIKKNG